LLLRLHALVQVNPTKIYLELINDYETNTGQESPLPRNPSMEEAALVPAVADRLAARFAKLRAVVLEIIGKLREAVPQMLYGVRWICRELNRMARERFRDATEKEWTAIVGGFLILRFANTMIIAPDATNVVSVKPSKLARRNLTLVAKVLQSLTNGVAFGTKEPFMEPLNDFMDEAWPQLKALIDEVIDVDDLEEALSFDRFLLATTIDFRKAKTMSIPFNELMSLHSLVADNIKQTLSPNDPLLKLLFMLGPVQKQVPRAEDSLCVLTLEDTSGDETVEELASRQERSKEQQRRKAMRLEVWDYEVDEGELQDADERLTGGSVLRVSQFIRSSQEETQELVRETKILLYDILSTTAKTEDIGQDLEGIPAARSEGPVLQEVFSFHLSRPLSGTEAILHQKVKTLQRRLQALASAVTGDPACLHTSLFLSIAAALDKMGKALAKVNRNKLKLERALVDVKDIHARNMESRTLYEVYFNNIRTEQNHHARSQSPTRHSTRDRPQTSTRGSFSFPSFSSSASAAAAPAASPAGSSTSSSSSSSSSGRDKQQKVKFSYRELVERHVIASSDIPPDYHKFVQFFITRNVQLPGRFDITVKVKTAGFRFGQRQSVLFLDELLELQSRGTPHFEMEGGVVVLNVNMLIHTIDRTFINPHQPMSPDSAAAEDGSPKPRLLTRRSYST